MTFYICVFATTETHHNQNSIRRSSGQPTRYVIALPYAKLLCSLLWSPRSPGSHFRLIHPWLKALKNWRVWFLANYREKRVPTSGISLENTMPKIRLWQKQHCSSHCFSLAEKCCRVAEFCTIQKVTHYCAHPNCIYIAIRSFTDVAQLRVPQPGELYTHLLINQATLQITTLQSGTNWMLSGGVFSITIPLSKSWQCSFITPSCESVVSYSFSFFVQKTVVNNHSLHGGCPAKYPLEHFTP